MPKIDLTITISVVIAICAIISPILTTILNNHYLLKCKKIDMRLEAEKSSHFYKRGVYETYLKAVGKCIQSKGHNTLVEYGEIYPIALIYFPIDLQSDLITLNDEISNYYWENAQQKLNHLAPKIRTILENM